MNGTTSDQNCTKIDGQSHSSQIWNISGQTNAPDKAAIARSSDADCRTYRFGWCGWKPDWLQKINRPVWLLVCLCCYAFMQGLIVNGFINVVISTLEKRFDLPSTKTGLIASTYDIASATLVVFVGYYGERGHKVRWVAFGCVIFAVGAIVFALPHFTTGLNNNISGSLVCVEDTIDVCQGSSSLANYYYVFILSQVLHGIGVTPLYSLGTTMLDEVVDVHQSSLYLGIFYAVATIGPGVGYVVGGALLSIYTDFGMVDVASLGITPEDPGWIGAWWLGFIIGGAVSFFVAIPLFGFQKEFPDTQQVREAKVSQAHSSSSHQVNVDHHSFGKKIMAFPRAVKCLLINPTFVFLVFASCWQGLITAGFSTFGPKLVETQFGRTAGDASLLMGLCAIPGGGLGTFLGGYLSKRWKLKIRGMIKFTCFTTTVAMIAVLGLLARCPQELLVGVNVDYNGNTTIAEETLINECNSGCGCTRTEFNPVCGDNGLEYFDPCFAGCTEISQGAQVFSGCSCLKQSPATNTTLTAIAGKCPNDCGYLSIFLICLVVLMVFHFMSGIPSLSALLRCVPESQRSLAIGVQWIIIRALGTIPGPIIFGAALDNSCILWQQDCKGTQGSCFLYNGSSISWKFFLIGFGFLSATLLCFVGALWTYKGPDDDAEDEKDGIKMAQEDDRKEKDTIPDMNRMVSSSSQLAIIANESLPEYEDPIDVDTHSSSNHMERSRKTRTVSRV